MSMFGVCVCVCVFVLTASIVQSSRWTREAVLLLIEAYAANKHLLDRSTYKKADVYRRIAEHMASFGHKVTYHDCVLKMDNLLWRFLLS